MSVLLVLGALVPLLSQGADAVEPADGCTKIDSQDIGRALTVVLGEVEVTVTGWTEKAGEPNEYIGFTYSVSGLEEGAVISYEVKGGQDRQRGVLAGEGSVLFDSEHAISWLTFCLDTSSTTTTTGGGSTTTTVDGTTTTTGGGSTTTTVDGTTTTTGGGSTTTTTRERERDGRPGGIVVEKQTIPDGSTVRFTFEVSWSDAAVSLADGERHESGALLPGTYAVSEIGDQTTAPGGWDLIEATCSDGSDPGAISLQAGEVVVCVFTNGLTDVGGIQIETTTTTTSAATAATSHVTTPSTLPFTGSADIGMAALGVTLLLGGTLLIQMRPGEAGEAGDRQLPWQNRPR